MNDSQISGVYEVKVGANSSAAEMAKKVSEVETYLKDRLDEIKTRISTGETLDLRLCRSCDNLVVAGFL